MNAALTPLEADQQWFAAWRSSPQYAAFQRRPVAYFCAEYALQPNLETYAGGLGVLAGDMVREAADQALSLVAIGLHYREGYVSELDESGPREIWANITPAEAGFELLTLPSGEPLRVSVPVQDRLVWARVWRHQHGTAAVSLLDTDLEENQPADRLITSRLYPEDKELRLKQELVLGIGGLRLLDALGIHPGVYHLNEGHSAMLTLELIRHQMRERGLGFAEARQFARRRTVFTNHTLVAAGNEVYSGDLVALLLTRYAEEIDVPTAELVRLGLVQDSSEFSMTMLSLRQAGVVNAVSRRHAREARQIWTDHPMVAVTNGIHLPTWDALVGTGSDRASLWQAHQQRKAELLEAIRRQTGLRWDSNHLLLGWARRMVSYKRPLALVQDPARFRRLAEDQRHPVHAVFAGRPHPSDVEGQRIAGELRRLAQGDLAGLIAYLPDYRLDTARLLTAGCDVWLNTPVAGFEACGTSGLKAALNGALPCTTRDGWADEAELYRVGWPLDNDRLPDDLLETISQRIVPLYYQRDASGLPALWAEHLANARAMAQNQFSATRMLRRYIELLYS